MEVRRGIATEYGKEKFDISLDETDVIRIINEYGISQETGQLTTVQVMLLLTAEADRFVLVQAPKFGRDVEDVRRQISANREQFAAALSMVTGLSLDECRKKAMPESSR